MTTQPVPTYRQLIMAYAARTGLVLLLGFILLKVVMGTRLSPIYWFTNDVRAVQDTFNNMMPFYGQIIGLYIVFVMGPWVGRAEMALDDTSYYEAKRAYALTLKKLPKDERKRRLQEWKQAYRPIFDGMYRLWLQRGLQVKWRRAVVKAVGISFQICALCFGAQLIYMALDVHIANLITGGILGVYLLFAICGWLVEFMIKESEPPRDLPFVPNEPTAPATLELSEAAT